MCKHACTCLSMLLTSVSGLGLTCLSTCLCCFEHEHHQQWHSLCIASSAGMKLLNVTSYIGTLYSGRSRTAACTDVGA